MGRAARENAWQQLNGSFKRRWPTLTDVDLITANREHLTQNIEDRYGIPRAEAEKQLAGWQRRQKEIDCLTR